MYQVSDEFKAAMHEEAQHSRLRGVIITGGRTIPFTENNIKAGDLYLYGQCSGRDNVEIGTVYTTELSATLTKLDIPRYSLKGAVISVSVELLAGGEYEGVPLGVYNVNEANWTAQGVEVVAYDNMTKLDKRCNVKNVSGTPYELAELACTECHVDLGIPEEQFAAFANGGDTLVLYPDNEIETWRDFIAWLAQACGCFAVMDRMGRLVFRQYGVEPVDRLDQRHRFADAKFSDFETRYTGISCVNISKQMTIYYGLEQDDALTYNLGSNPFLQHGSDETRRQMCMAVLDAISVIRYVPMEVSMIGSPAYDLGDVLVFEDGIADGDKLYCITQFDWNYSGAYSIVGVGQNPALANARSKTDKNIAGLLNQADEGKMYFITYTNSARLSVGDGERKRIMDIKFATAKNDHVAVDMEILASIETTEEGGVFNWIEHDAELEFAYYLNNEELTPRHPTQTLMDGNHIIHLRHDIETIEAQIHRWQVYVTATGGGMIIEPKGIQAVVMGQGLVGETAWDGTIDIDEEMQIIHLEDAAETVVIAAMTESIQTGMQVPTGAVISEGYTVIRLEDVAETVQIAAMTETIEEVLTNA